MITKHLSNIKQIMKIKLDKSNHPIESNISLISRRSFFKLFGAGTAASAMYGCGTKTSKTSESQSGSRTDEPPKDKMTCRSNPNTGDTVSLLGYGCMRFPTRKKEGSEEEEIDQELVNQLIDYALAHGVNYFDCSPRYIQGMCEGATGRALARHPRNKFFIATKMSNFDPEKQKRENSIKMYRNSFKELQVDVIDYYLLHSIGGGGMANFNARFIDNGMLDFLKEEREKGTIRNLGFSFHGDVEVYDEMMRWHDEGKVHWDFVQIQLNYVDWQNLNNNKSTDAHYLYDELHRRGIPAVIMEPLLGGRLATLPQYLFLQLKTRRPEESAASWAFRFAGTPDGVLTVLSGMTAMEHLQNNLWSYSPLEHIDKQEDELLAEIAKEYQKYPLVACTNCQYCMPCPYGLNIPGVFMYYNKCVNEGSVPSSSQDKNYRKLRRDFLVGYDRALESIRQADHCINCNKCVPKCPQHIRIPREMRRINDFVEMLKQGKDFGEASGQK